MKNLSLFILLFSLSILQAQKIVTKETLLNNKDITWVGEYEVTIPFDLIHKEMGNIDFTKFQRISSERSYWNIDIYSDSFNKTMNVEKINFLKLKEMDIHSSFAYVLAKSAIKQNVSAYGDAELKTALTSKEKSKLLLSYDSLKVINPETYEEEDTVIAFEISDENLLLCRAKLLVYYNNKTSSFNTVCSAIAPIVDRNSGVDNFTRSETLVWLPVYMLDSTLNYGGPNINYVVNSMLTLEISKAKELKSLDKTQAAIDKLLRNIQKTPDNFELFQQNLNTLYEVEQKLISKTVKENLFINTDTIMTADPVTYEVFEYVVKNEAPSSKTISSLRFEINWYWDRKEQKLYACNLSFAPINELYTDGILRYKGPIFYQKLCKGKIYKPEE